MRRLLFACAVLCSLGATARAAEHLRINRLDVSRWPTVQMYLTYTDADNRPVTGRQKEEFKLLLDSAEQGSATVLKSFDTLGEPVNVVIVAQVSGAMQEVLDELKRGVRAVADALDPKTKPKIGLLGYAAETKRLSELGSPADVDAAVSNLAIDTEGVEVRMLDAVRTAIDLLNAAPKDQRKLIVLFSDGVDANLDKKGFSALGKRAAEAGIAIDTIGYASFEATKLNDLSQLAKQSSGTERRCKSAADVGAQFNAIADEIRKQYQATFEVSLNADGKPHLFQALVDSPGHNNPYSAEISQKIPDKNVHPQTDTGKKQPSRWWLWTLLGVGGLGIVLLLAWLIFREKEESFEDEPAPAPAQKQPEPKGPMKTMALDVGSGGKNPALGWIVATSGQHTNKTYKFKPGRTLIGTGTDCDIVIDDQFMSSHHCEARVESGGYKLVDLGSTNGIVVNGKKVNEHELVDNDQFRLGRTEFKFKSIT